MSALAEAGLRATVLTDAGALRATAADWRALWERAPGATPFQHPAWLAAWWEAFAPGELATIAVRSDDGRLVGLAPFYRERGDHGVRLLPLHVRQRVGRLAPQRPLQRDLDVRQRVLRHQRIFPEPFRCDLPDEPGGTDQDVYLCL